MTLKGSLAPGFLLAAPKLGDPNFQRTVVLMGHHDDQGAMGWVLNGRELAQVRKLLQEAGVVPTGVELPLSESFTSTARVGGPVLSGSAWVIYEDEPGVPSVSPTHRLDERLLVTGAREMVETIAHGAGPSRFRLVLGYAGWGPQQLEHEISAGAWMPAEFTAELLWTDPSVLWFKAYEKAAGVSPMAFISSRGGSALSTRSIYSAILALWRIIPVMSNTPDAPHGPTSPHYPGAEAVAPQHTQAATEDFSAFANGLSDGWKTAMGVTFLKVNSEEVIAELVVGPVHRQPLGIVHGGVYSGLVEAVCSVGAGFDAMKRGKLVVGLENHTSFLSAVREGIIRATARPLSRGSRSQVWEASITDSNGRVAATGRLRLLVLDRGAPLGGSSADLQQEGLSHLLFAITFAGCNDFVVVGRMNLQIPRQFGSSI